MGSGLMTAPSGRLFREHKNRGLDRPRLEKENMKTSCVSVGMPGGGSSDTRMMFQQRQPVELWGKQTREPRRQDKPDFAQQNTKEK